MFGESVSRFSSLGDPFKSRTFGGGDNDSMSNFGAQANGAFGNVFAVSQKQDENKSGITINRENSVFSEQYKNKN